jgi:hypothetical protein
MRLVLQSSLAADHPVLLFFFCHFFSLFLHFTLARSASGPRAAANPELTVSIDGAVSAPSDTSAELARQRHLLSLDLLDETIRGLAALVAEGESHM